MLTSLLLLAVTAGLAGPPAKHDPPIHIWYNWDGDFAYRDRAKVYTRAAESGYLIVLRSDLNGHVRVLAPIDPRDDQHVDGGKKYELKGRGGREAFVAEDTAGHGTVLAAWSSTPFNFDRYVKDGRWDLDALAGQGAQTDDPEARLMAIVDAMKAPGAHFDYDVAVYTVSPPPRYALAPYGYPYGPGYWGYNGWWGYGPAFGARVFVPFGRVGFGGRFRR
jgi:hypothetical protein